MNVYLIRHGETVWSAERRYQGSSDVPLSREGAKKLRRAAFFPENVFISGLARTRKTAEILFPGASLTDVPDLREMDFGAFEGKNFAELEHDPAYREWVDSGCLAACPGGESKEAFCRRVCAAFERLMDDCDGRDPVIVAHGGTLMAVLERFGRPERPYFDWHVSPGHGYLLTADWRRERILRLAGELDFAGGD